MNEYYMKIALEEAKQAYYNGDVPIGAVIVYKNRIICKTHNQKEMNKIATEHAEILAINEACRILGDWRLNECEMYVTIEPCLMCAGAIIQSRIKRLIYGTTNEKFGYVKSIDSILNNEKNNHHVQIISGVLENETRQLVQKFFKQKRN